MAASNDLKLGDQARQHKAIGLKDSSTRVCSADEFRRSLKIAGKGLRTASINDEEWLEESVINEPDSFLRELRESALKVDLFSFTDPLGLPAPRFQKYHFEWDNAAVVPINTFEDWWERRLPQESRKNVRRAARRGVSVRPVAMDDALVAGIKNIYDETPIRQGRRFWHYKKDLATIRRENSSYLERSDFLGAYFQEQLIGFIKIVYSREVGRIMQILSMNAHFDKRPANALLAKAVERCCEKQMRFFVYGKYIYGKKSNSPVTEFKRRNGFEELRFARYFVPLTLAGRIALRFGLHLGIRDTLPEGVTAFLLNLRSKLYARTLLGSRSNGVRTVDAEN